MKHFRMTAGSFVVGLLQKYSKDWKERYLDIQARHSRALCRTQASVKCVSHKCLLRWGQCVCIGVYSKCMCLSVCGDVVYGSGWFILSTVGPVISWGWASLSPRPAQPSPRARLSSGVLMKCRAWLPSCTSPSYFPLRAYNSKYFFQVCLRVSGGKRSNNPFFVFYFYFLWWRVDAQKRETDFHWCLLKVYDSACYQTNTRCGRVFNMQKSRAEDYISAVGSAVSMSHKCEQLSVDGCLD